MSYLIFDQELDALALVAALDTILGYPRGGTNIGGGEHADDPITLHYTDIQTKPEGAENPQFAVYVDDVVEGVMAQAATAAGLTLPALTDELDATWYPPGPGG